MIIKKSMLTVVIALAAASSAVAARGPTDFVTRHVANAKAANVAGIVADYADNAVIVTPPGMATPSGVFAGKSRMTEFFRWLTSAPNLPGVRTMVVKSEVVAPGTVLMHWTQFPGTKKEVQGNDVFVIRNGKIQFQSVAPSK